MAIRSGLTIGARLKSLISPIGGLYLFMGFTNGGIAFFTLLYAIFPAIIGVVAVPGAMKNEEGALEALILMAISTIGIGGAGLILGVLAIAYTIVGVGLVRRKSWSRVPGILLSVPLMGVCMPIGTVMGVLALVVLISQEVVAEFSARS